MADRWGRTQTILLWSCVSAGLSFSIGWLISLPVAVVVALACLYNFAAIADSSTHSTVLAESVPAHHLGVAYAVRSVVGFGAGVVSPVVFGWALDLAGGARTGTDGLAWGIAWSTLGWAPRSGRSPPCVCAKRSNHYHGGRCPAFERYGSLSFAQRSAPVTAPIRATMRRNNRASATCRRPTRSSAAIPALPPSRSTSTALRAASCRRARRRTSRRCPR